MEEGKSYDREIVNGPIKNSITEILKLKTTQIDVKVKDNIIYTTLTDRGVVIYKIKEDNNLCPLIKDGTVSLSFLNRAAKYNFSRLMGVDSINYGSVFLFRNGFRILPFGETGDDSWGIDFRAQQGRARHLSSRDLMGRVDIFVENVSELKEVSSRDSGLVDTPMSRQVLELFKQSQKRLERYVVGVLWGEAFLRNEYYKDEYTAEIARKELQRIDKDLDCPSYIIDSSLGSKIDFVRLIKTLSSDNNVKVLYYNTELANLVSSSFSPDDVKPQFISDLEIIAERTGNKDLISKIEDAKRRIDELTHQKIEAERKAVEAERLQREAEDKALKAEEERRVAEAKAKAEEELRRRVELDKLRAENEKIKAENARLVAEKKAKEEENKRKQIEKEKQLESLKVEFYKKASNPDTDALIHHVKNNNSRINDKVDELIQLVSKGEFGQESSYLILESLSHIKKLSQKTLVATDLILSCDLAQSDSQKINLPLFIQGYLEEEIKSNVKCHFLSDIELFAVYGSKLDLALLIDNFVKNSEDWHAKNIWLCCSRQNNALQLDIYDDGDGLIDPFKQDPNQIFDFAKSGRNGSGFGMYLIKETLKSLRASIEIDTPINNKGMHFKILFK